jgi:ADYC domain
MGRLAGAALLAGLAGLSPCDAASAARGVVVENSLFRITLEDGRVLAQEALAGVVLTLGDDTDRSRRIRIDSAERDPADPAGELVLYTLSEQSPETGEWRNICLPDFEGRRAGFPLSGAFTRDMRHVESPGRILITCTGGAEGKCIRFGYKPWRQARDGTSLAPYYQACVRLVRADYCGDGVGQTRDGTPIDIFDRIGVQRDEKAPGMSFEAAFGPDGATCVAHPRLPDEPSLSRLANLCPRLAGLSGPSCDETSPGLIFVRSLAPPPGK